MCVSLGELSAVVCPSTPRTCISGGDSYSLFCTHLGNRPIRGAVLWTTRPGDAAGLELPAAEGDAEPRRRWVQMPLGLVDGQAGPHCGRSRGLGQTPREIWAALPPLHPDSQPLTLGSPRLAPHPRISDRCPRPSSPSVTARPGKQASCLVSATTVRAQSRLRRDCILLGCDGPTASLLSPCV